MKQNRTYTFRHFWLDYQSEVIFGLVLSAMLIASAWLSQYIPEPLFESIINPMMSCCCAAICFFGAALCFKHHKSIRLRRSWAYMLIAWGAWEILMVIASKTLDPAIMEMGTDTMTGTTMVVACFFAWLLFIYPTEVLRPGWLNWTHTFQQLLPLLLLGLLDYYVPADLRWLIALYPIGLFIILIGHIRKYREWCEDNFSTLDDIDVQWIVRYVMMVMMSGLVFWWLCFSHQPARAFTQQWFLMFLLAYTTERVLYRPDPWKQLRSTAEEEPENEDPAKAAYRATLDAWIEQEKPYLNPDFQLIDLRQVLPLNRTYLSRLINSEYGCSFYQWVNGLRIEEAKRDPMEHPMEIEMPNAGNESQRNQLFIVEDMTRQMLQVNFIGEYTSRDSVVIPIVFDGITFINPYSTKDPSPEGTLNNLGGSMSKKGGAAIYYRWQRRYGGSDPSSETPDFNAALHPDSALIDGVKVTLPKLTISNCIFMDNGKRTENHAERSPAVRIDHGGGSSLIVNTLFHSNAGAPVYARTFDILEEENDLALVPNDVRIINCTSALNDGHIRLESDNSEVHNSLIWLDDLHNDTTIQLQMGASDQWDKTTNKDRDGIDGRMSHNAVWGCFQAYDDEPDGDPVGNNHPLSSENNNIFKGPGFLSPYLTASTSEQRRERSFRLNPSIRTHGMANKEIYLNRVFFRVYPDTCAATHNKYWRRADGFKSRIFSNNVAELVNDSDLAAKPRLSGDGMERGAYECLAVLQRVLYVDPLKPAFSAGDGSNWEKAFGQGQIQNAIDAAAVYTYMNQSESLVTRKAYVFVKGSGDASDHYNLEARDGVSIYGSLPVSFNDTAFVDPEQDKFTDSECQRFVNYVRATVAGVASSKDSPTKINSIHVTGDDFQTGFLMDGFMITNPSVHPERTPILLENSKTALRNCLVVNNTIPHHPVADIRRGLLYNCLFYNDSADIIVKVGGNGLVLNNTIVADNADVTPLHDTYAAIGAVQNTIALNKALTTPTCFAPYLTQNNLYTLPAYLTTNASLAYQLHEHSLMIDDGTMDSSLPALFDSYKADNTINFSRDRDVLGNPRKLGESVDKGAFETWRVAAKKAQEITALTNKLIGRQESLDADDATRNAAFTEHYGGNAYPHQGSVVYLMDSSAMTMQYDTENDFKDFKNNTIILRPGYMLLKPDASFYGNGHEVQMNYLAVEKRFKDQRYALTAMPFNYNTGNITSTTYGEWGTLTSHLTPLTFTTHQYSGAARSVKDYVFQPANSAAWLSIDTLNRTANDAYLMDFGATCDTVLRFNAFAPLSGQYVYTEDGDDKTVYLTQYDNRTAGSGSELNFTRQEDMGWNMKGLPWLVTNYRTDTILWAGNYLRQMHIPHVLYDLEQTTRSWDRGTTLSVGNGFLTQTATTKDKESVLFHIPLFGRNDKPARPLIRLAARNNPHADVLTAIPDSTADKYVDYTYGRDGVKWMLKEGAPQLYLLDAKRMARISLLGAAPTEVDIPVGVYVPQADEPTPFTFSLPEKEAFAGYSSVWLIDYQLNRYTNLMEQDYEVTLESGENNRRFAVRIGGFPMTDKNGKRSYLVFAHDGILHVRGLIPGDQVALYAPSGQILCTATASSSEWTTPLPIQSGYVVRVNDTSHKVLR